MNFLSKTVLKNMVKQHHCVPKLILNQSRHIQYLNTHRYHNLKNNQIQFVPLSSRFFSAKQNETPEQNDQAKSENKEEQPQDKQQSSNEEDKKQQKQDEDYDDQYEDKAEFKTYRRIMFFIGKAIKYTMWGAFAMFLWHLGLIKKYSKPEEQFLATQVFLDIARMFDRSVYEFKVLMTKPGMSKMLPDQMKIPGQQAPKTLVMNLNGTLVHQSYSLGVGVEIYKRPGLTAFLGRMSQKYELCIFGMGEQGSIQEICEALDPQYSMIQGRFGRESTLLKNGKYVKDLTYLNRKLENIVYIDFSDEAVANHPENAIILSKFEGDTGDRELHDLIPFLDHLSQYPGDVRKEIARYGKETCAKKYMEQQQMKMQFIQNRQNSGVGGLMKGKYGGAGKFKTAKFGDVDYEE